MSPFIVFFLSVKTKVIADDQSIASFFGGMHIKVWMWRIRGAGVCFIFNF